MDDERIDRILVVDDEADMREMLVDVLLRGGFEAAAVASGAEMMSALESEPFSLVVMDLRLVGEDGLDLARRLRQVSRVPVMILTGKGDESDRIHGLESVADEYLMKPFNPRELIARARALVRRASIVSSAAEKAADRPEQVAFGPWLVDLTNRVVKNADGVDAELAPAEFDLLIAFMGNRHKVLSREDLLELMGRVESDVFDRSIDVLVTRLRKKIEANPRNPQFIRTERGLGYVFDTSVSRR